jgi:hypothetical protein
MMKAFLKEPSLLEPDYQIRKYHETGIYNRESSPIFQKARHE